jgi:CysZ protein
MVSGLVTGAVLIALAVGLWPLSFGWAQALVGSGGTAREVGAATLGFVLFTLTFFITAVTVPNLVLAPLQDPLSEATDVCCGAFTPQPFSVAGLVRGTLEALAHTVLRVLTQLMGLAVLVPLNLIPVAGSALWLVLGSSWSAFCLAIEHLSNPMARHLYPFSQVITALRRRVLLALGFGGALSVLLWVPLLNAFLMPVAVVAGTLLFHSLRQVGAIEKPAARSPA